MNETWKDFLQERHKEILLLASAGIAILALVAVFSFTNGGGGSYVPEEYIRAREDAIKISQEIGGLSSEINQLLANITTKNNTGDYNGALAIARSGASQTNQVGKKAEELLGALENMVESIDKVKPASAVKVGKDAISVGIKMVERLVVYSNLSNDLIQKIEAKLNGGNVKEDEIRQTIDSINEEVRFINSLNSDYQALATQFDNLTKDSQ